MKKPALISMFFGLIIILLTGCDFLDNEHIIVSFDDCVKNGGRIAESYPRQCFLGDQSFTEDLDVINSDKEKNSENFDQEPLLESFVGKIIALQNGKDGSTVTLHNTNGKIINATVSIPNLGKNSDFNFSQLQIGKIIEVSGETFMLENEKNMIVKFATNKNSEEENPVGYAFLCKNVGGKWIAEHQECEGMSRENCDNFDGLFDACASPCRHDSSAQMCIQSCVLVCSFINQDTKKLDCKNSGGEWKPVGKLGLPSCVYKYSDAGQVCEKSRECQGNCIVCKA